MMNAGPWQQRRIWDWETLAYRWYAVAEVGVRSRIERAEKVEFDSEITEQVYWFLLEHGPASATAVGRGIEGSMVSEGTDLYKKVCCSLAGNPRLFEVVGEVRSGKAGRIARLWATRGNGDGTHTG